MVHEKKVCNIAYVQISDLTCLPPNKVPFRVRPCRKVRGAKVITFSGTYPTITQVPQASQQDSKAALLKEKSTDSPQPL